MLSKCPMQTYISNLCLEKNQTFIKPKSGIHELLNTRRNIHVIMVYALLAKTLFSYMDENIASIDTEDSYIDDKTLCLLS